MRTQKGSLLPVRKLKGRSLKEGNEEEGWKEGAGVKLSPFQLSDASGEDRNRSDKHRASRLHSRIEATGQFPKAGKNEVGFHFSYISRIADNLLMEQFREINFDVAIPAYDLRS